MFGNNSEKEFRFENFKTAEEAREYLLEKYPIGSDVDVLIEAIRHAGADIKEKDLSNARKFKEYDKWWEEGTVKAFTFYYDKASPFFMIINYLKWSGMVRINKMNKIIDFGFSRTRAY